MEIRDNEHLEVLFEMMREQVEMFIADEMKDHPDFKASPPTESFPLEPNTDS